MISTSDRLYLIPEMAMNDITIHGKGQKQLVIITDSESFQSEEQNTLNKMMAAIKYMPDVDLITVSMPKNQSISFSMLQLVYKDLIIFGLTPAQLGLNIDHKMYEVLHFDKSRVLVCDSIREIIATPQKKQWLWTKLQSMFLQ